MMVNKIASLRRLAHASRSHNLKLCRFADQTIKLEYRVILFIQGWIGACTDLFFCSMCHSLAKPLYIFAENITTMEEFFKSFKEDIERAQAIWIINNMDLICGYAKIKYTFLAYLQMGLYCLTLPYQFVKLFVHNLKRSN